MTGTACTALLHGLEVDMWARHALLLRDDECSYLKQHFCKGRMHRLAQMCERIEYSLLTTL